MSTYISRHCKTGEETPQGVNKASKYGRCFLVRSHGGDHHAKVCEAQQ